jgi:nucleotide-binding universal stress UspA family protein
VQEECERFASLSNLLYPMEITPSSIEAIPHLVSLTDATGSKVTLLHLAHLDIQSASERQRIRDRLTSEMMELFPDRARRSIADVIVEFGPIADTIIEFSVARCADCIVLGVRRGGAFAQATTHSPWSIGHQIIAQASCPVLTIRGGHKGR